jgi:CDP-4-dehydro-6-deoxyglucose reductase
MRSWIEPGNRVKGTLMPTLMKARLVESHEIAHEVKHFVFEAPEVERLAFTPGQFVSFVADVRGKKITRAYSICSPPDGNRFELCLNRLEHGIFSPHLFEMNPGDTLEMRPPLGMFVLKEPPREAILVATGTGIAPFRSILHAALGTRPFTLIFGTRFERTLLYGHEFQEMAAREPRFHYWPTLSRPDPDWTGRTGYVQKHLPDAIGDRRDLDVYICGLKIMVDDVRNILKEMGFDRKQIVYEKYD